jgi:hypothetical protein
MELKLGYLGLACALAGTLIFFVLKVIRSKQSNPAIAKYGKILIGLLFLWHIYVYAMAQTGILQNFSFPPNFAIFTIFPLFIFTGVFIYKNWAKSWLISIPPHWLVFVQAFRIIVETLFVFTVSAKILHPNVTIEGYNFDMIFAFTAPIMGILLLKNFKKYRKLALYWNYLGLAVLASVVSLFQIMIYNPALIDGNNIPLSPSMTTYPFILVAGFLMPTAVFIHFLSIAQLNKMGKKEAAE